MLQTLLSAVGIMGLSGGMLAPMHAGSSTVTYQSAIPTAAQVDDAGPGPDFDGDGYADLAIGSPFEEVGGVRAAGAVNVIYGGPAGLSATGNQFWQKDSPGILERAEQGSRVAPRPDSRNRTSHPTLLDGCGMHGKLSQC